jgi:Tetracyclin repressor-like, C-terminal domain
VSKDASATAMSRRPKTDRGRRNFTLDDLLTDAESGLTEDIARDLASEIEKRFGEMASVSEARAFCAGKSSRELCQRIEFATKGKSGADALRALAQAMRAYALERPGLSAACFRSLVNDGSKWPADGELMRTLSGIFARLNLTDQQARRVLSAVRILVHGFALEEMTLSFAEAPEHEGLYELTIDAFIRGLLASASEANTGEP